jgi:hypothetical protein
MSTYRAVYIFRKGPSVVGALTEDLATLRALAKSASRHEDITVVVIHKRYADNIGWNSFASFGNGQENWPWAASLSLDGPDRDDEDADDAEARSDYAISD